MPVFGSFSRIKILNDKLRLDYILHGFAYFLVFIYYLVSIRKSLLLLGKRSLLKLVLLTLLLAFSTESLQLFIPGRLFNKIDIFSNIIGIIAGVIVALAFVKKKSIGNS